MAFMQPEITDKTQWEIDKDGMVFPEGTLDAELVCERRVGYGARLSASGYMDCTDWAVFATVSEAHAYLAEHYDLCAACLEELDADFNCPNCDTKDEE